MNVNFNVNWAEWSQEGVGVVGSRGWKRDWGLVGPRPPASKPSPCPPTISPFSSSFFLFHFLFLIFSSSFFFLISYYSYYLQAAHLPPNPARLLARQLNLNIFSLFSSSIFPFLISYSSYKYGRSFKDDIHQNTIICLLSQSLQTNYHISSFPPITYLFVFFTDL